MAHVASNTEYFEVGGGPWGCPRPTTPIPPLTYYYPYSSPYLLLSLFLPLPTTIPIPPLTYYVYTPTPPLIYYYSSPSPSYHYPYSSPYLLFPWSEVTSMVTYVMMTNSLIHYCQSMKHIYMDTVYKLS